MTFDLCEWSCSSSGTVRFSFGTAVPLGNMEGRRAGEMECCGEGGGDI